MPEFSQTPMKTSLAIFSLIPALAMSETLQQKLDARSQEAAAKGDPAVRAEFAKGIQAVVESGIINRAIKVGDTAPDFNLKDQDQKDVKLSDYRGKVVMVDFWGDW